MATTTASCRPSTYPISGADESACMIGSSVVPGLPNILLTPSSLSTRRKASRPVMVLVTRASGIGFLPRGRQGSAAGRGDTSLPVRRFEHDLAGGGAKDIAIGGASLRQVRHRRQNS